MPRHRGGAPRSAAAELGEWAAKKRPKPEAKKKTPKGVSDKQFLQLLDDVAYFRKLNDWSDARPGHFVALYAELHHHVYGIEPADLGPLERLAAQGMVTRLLRDFDRNLMARFIAWTWTREIGREKWRAEINSDRGARVTWRHQFSNWMLTDFRLAEARTKGKQKR